jgi:hypothetical protein
MKISNWTAGTPKTFALAGVMGLLAVLTLGPWSAPANAGAVNKQTAALYQLQAAFHREESVRDPVNGDSPAVINQRIRDMLALWTADGSFTVQAGGPLDGTYTGQGDPDDLATCPAPSAAPSNRGTLCTLFKYVAGAFQPANKLVSLAPTYLTEFTIQGNKATVSFQCHFFNVATDPTTGKPLWTAVGHSAFVGSAEKHQGKWLFSQATPMPAGIPLP